MNVFPIAVAAVVLAISTTVRGDIVEQIFKSPGTGNVTSGYVLQGSRNMRKLGDRRSSAVISVPALSSLGLVTPVQTVIPALETEELKPKPRFGFGSDYQPEEKKETNTSAIPLISPQLTVPGYQFRYSYQPREYWPVYRYSYNPFWYGGSRCGPSYGSGYQVTYRQPGLFFSFGR
tara:strand:- start:1742 stop:2269 length:528 start_codon:yes stop_codon:yes gene_type:complete